ncbi:MAG: DNA recombination protein RmuC [Actinobacteria bacterium]|nr:DNA recombination protein RmuC [Actinomycetota bacterium]
MKERTTPNNNKSRAAESRTTGSRCHLIGCCSWTSSFRSTNTRSTSPPKTKPCEQTPKCSFSTPLTLYAFLVVIRQATDSFHTEKNAADIMRRINLFHKEWDNYTKAVDTVEDQFKKLVSAIESINKDGTRFKKLNVQVREIEKIRKREGIAEVDAAVAETLELESGDE